MRKKWISRRNEGWALWDLNPRPPACRDESSGARAVARSTSKCTPSRLSRIGLGVLALGACALMPGCFFDNPSMASAKSWGSKTKPKNHDLWLAVGRCEQPGREYGGVRWSHPGPTYQGGLGFYAASWDAFKPKGYPDNAGDATWRQQMIVAQRLYDAVGWGWGCDPR